MGTHAERRSGAARSPWRRVASNLVDQSCNQSCHWSLLSLPHWDAANWQWLNQTAKRRLDCDLCAICSPVPQNSIHYSHDGEQTRQAWLTRQDTFLSPSFFCIFLINVRLALRREQKTSVMFQVLLGQRFHWDDYRFRTPFCSPLNADQSCFTPTFIQVASCSLHLCRRISRASERGAADF